MAIVRYGDWKAFHVQPHIKERGQKFFEDLLEGLMNDEFVQHLNENNPDDLKSFLSEILCGLLNSVIAAASHTGYREIIRPLEPTDDKS